MKKYILKLSFEIVKLISLLAVAGLIGYGIIKYIIL